MFNPFAKQPAALDTLIDRKLLDIVEENPDSDKFVTATDQIVKLHELKTSEHKLKGQKSVSPDVLIQAATVLASVGMIILAEQNTVLSQKALSFAPKPRI